MSLNPRGYGLIEAVVAAGLAALLATSALAGLSRLQRDVGRYAGRAAAGQTLRGAAQLLRFELRDLAPAAGEILAFSPGSIIYRATRGSGEACGFAPGAILVDVTTWSSLRQPAAGRDTLVLLAQPGDVEIVVAASGSGVTATCPNGAPAQTLPYDVPVPDPIAGASFPAPLLLTEAMEIRGYASAGEWWIGARSVSAGETIQPAFGPIAPSGLQVVALDSVGSPTTMPGQVRHLVLSITAPSGDSLQLRLDLSRGTWP